MKGFTPTRKKDNLSESSEEIKEIKVETICVMLWSDWLCKSQSISNYLGIPVNQCL